MNRPPLLRVIAAIAAVVLGVALLAASPAPAGASTEAGPTRTARFIVQVDPSVGDVAGLLTDLLVPLGGGVEQVFTKAIHGAVITLPAGLPIGGLTLPGVLTIEPEVALRTAQANPPWGLDRIDQRGRTLDGSYDYVSTGAGVDAYVIDTGIRVTHLDFAGRAITGIDLVDGGPADDCSGHGTHVAGTLGGGTFGVAKSVRLIAVRVLDCEGKGTSSGLLAGIEWVIAHHTTRPAVANMSFGGSASAAVDRAIRNLVSDGVTVAVAAGNEASNACGYSPGRVAEAITVAASDAADAMASFSNGGGCVDLFAPGVSIRSAWASGNTATTALSGTSMAVPHVAGAAARYLQANPTASPAAVQAALNSSATRAQVTKTGRQCVLLILFCRPATANNRLLHVSPLS